MAEGGSFHFSIDLASLLGIGVDEFAKPTEDEQLAGLAIRDLEQEDYVNSLLTLTDVGTPGGAATLDDNGFVPPTELGSGTPDATTVLFGDQTWRVPPNTVIQSAGVDLTQRERLNFEAGLLAVDNGGSGRTDARIDTAVVVRKFAATIGNGVLTTITVTHNLGTRDVTVAVYDTSTFAEVAPTSVTHATVNTVVLAFGSPPANNGLRCVVHG